MKNTLVLVAFSIISLAQASTCEAGLLGFFTQEHRDWSFIQSVGGMEVNLAKGRLLAVSCDVSGTRTITAKPTVVNSGIGVRKLECSRLGSVIRLSVVTSLIEKGMNSDCGSIDLSAYPAGSYSVVYLNPDGTTHSLGKIKLT